MSSSFPAARLCAIAAGILSAATAILAIADPAPAMTSASRSSIACSIIIAKTQAYEEIASGSESAKQNSRGNASERVVNEAVDAGNATTDSIKEIAGRCKDASALNAFDAHYDVFRASVEHSRDGDWQTPLALAKRELDRCTLDYAATPLGARCRRLRDAADADERRWLARSAAGGAPPVPSPSASPSPH